MAVRYSNGNRYLDNYPIDLMKTSRQGQNILKRFFGGYEAANFRWLNEAEEETRKLYNEGSLGQGISISNFDNEDVENAGANPIQGPVFPEGDGDQPEVEPTIFGSPYRSIVQGWNQKIVSNNIDLSALIPFVEIYAVFAEDDIVYSESLNRFTGIKNRLIPVTFVSPPNSIEGSQPSLPPNVTPNSKIAKIGSSEGQLNNDYINYSSEQVSGGVYPPSDTVRSFRGQPGINDLAISRGSSGAFNIKYDVGITLPNPEIVNDQYEYSKLLLPNSTFLIIHGWKIANTTFFAESYPPVLTPGAVEPVNVSIGGTNGGFWNTNITTLYNFNFEFDNVGHLVGKLSFISAQTALLASIETSMVGTTMIKKLKETDPNILARVSGNGRAEERQNAIFLSGVPWSREDRNGGSIDDNRDAAAARALENLFRAASTIVGQGSAVTDAEVVTIQRLLEESGTEYEIGRLEAVRTEIETVLRDVNDNITEINFYLNDVLENPDQDADSALALVDSLLDQLPSYRNLVGDEWNENLYFNLFLLNAANEKRELLSFVAPSGFIADSIAVTLTPESSNLTAVQRSDAIRQIGRGYLIDPQLETFKPVASDSLPLNTIRMPEFGNNLQRLIFDYFSESENLNRDNYSRQNVTRFVDDELRSLITNTSVLSLPVVRSETIDNILPEVGENFEENFDNSLFMLEYTARGGNDLDDEPKDVILYQIRFPIKGDGGDTNSRAVVRGADNSYIFNNLGDTAPEGFREAVPVIVNPSAAPSTRDSNGNYPSGGRFIQSQILILNSGFSINRQKLLRNEEFDKPSVPRPLINENGSFFIPGITNVINSINDGQVAADLRNLRDSAKSYVEAQDAFRRVEIGFSGNTDFDIDGVTYTTYMRPAYFFLGSILESLSIATNRAVKFYYKPFPVRVNQKPFTINIPKQAGGDTSAVALLDDQIKFIEQRMIDNGYPEGVKAFPLSDYNYTEPDANDVNEVNQNYKEAWKDFILGFSSAMRDLLVDKENEQTGTYLDSNVFLDNLEVERIGDIRGTVSEIQDSINNDFVPIMIDQFVNDLIRNDSLRASYEEDNQGLESYNFYVFSPIELRSGIIIPGEYRTKATITEFQVTTFTDEYGAERVEELIAQTNDFAQTYLRSRRGVVQYDSFNGRVSGVRSTYRNPAVAGGRTQQENDIERLAQLMAEKSELSVEAQLEDIQVKSPFDIPINITTAEHFLTSEGNAPTHNLLKKIIDSAQETMPQLRLAMRTHSTDPSYIEIFASAINDDGIITEVIDEIDINSTIQGSDQTADVLRSTIIREGSRVLSNNVTVFNFGTSDSLVESFQMSSKLDPMAFATYMTPAILGGASMNVSNILRDGILNNDRDNILSDIKKILEDNIIGVEDFKTLQIINEDGQVDEGGLNRLRNILAGDDNNIVLRKTAMTLIDDLATQNVSLRNKLTALQSEYFNGLDYENTTSESLDTKIIPDSKYAGSILGTFLRTITVTIHGTAGFNVHDYVYIKGTMSGVEGLYIISNVSESVAIGSFTTTLECKLVEYTNNDQQTNPLAYRGEASIRALAAAQRKAGSSEVDISSLSQRLEEQGG